MPHPYGILLALTLASASVSAEPLLTDKVFAPDSFWYTPIPKDAPLHPANDALLQDFLRQKATYYNTVNINTRDYTSPVYVVGPDVPTVKVTQWDCQKKGYSDKWLGEQWSAVPIPAYAMPSRGTDAELAIYQPATDSLWEFWQMRKRGEAWQACWGGRMKNVSKNEGVFPGHYGTTATSLPFIGGLITPEELKRGEIRHAIGISLVEVDHHDVKSWPAHRSDGWNPERLPHRIPEGLRLRLDPSVDVEKLPLGRAGKTIARAAQKYGFIVWDKSGAIALRAQNAYVYLSRGQPDPYPALFEGKPNYAVLKGFPWDKLQFMPMHYGAPQGHKGDARGKPPAGKPEDNAGHQPWER